MSNEKGMLTSLYASHEVTIALQLMQELLILQHNSDALIVQILHLHKFIPKRFQ